MHHWSNFDSALKLSILFWKTLITAPTNGDAVELPPQRPRTITSPSTMAEFGPDLSSQLELNTSYMDYLEDAKCSIDQCRFVSNVDFKRT